MTQPPIYSSRPTGEIEQGIEGMIDLAQRAGGIVVESALAGARIAAFQAASLLLGKEVGAHPQRHFSPQHGEDHSRGEAIKSWLSR